MPASLLLSSSEEWLFFQQHITADFEPELHGSICFIRSDKKKPKNQQQTQPQRLYNLKGIKKQ